MIPVVFFFDSLDVLKNKTLINLSMRFFEIFQDLKNLRSVVVK